MSILQSRWETKTHPQFWTFGPKPRTTIHLFQSARYNSKTCSGAAPYDTLGPSPDPKLRIKSTTSRSCSSQRSACSSNHSWDVEKTAHGYWKAWIKRLWKSNTAYINNMCSCHNLISFMIQKLIVSHLWKLDNLKDTVVSNQPPKQPFYWLVPQLAPFIDSFSSSLLHLPAVDGSEILHHQGCMKPCKYWDKIPTSTG